jgi:NitT/TauT family transport system substrate-binding protein
VSEGAEKSVLFPAKTRIAYSSLSGNMAPLWVTQEAGFFKKYGLDVELVFIAGGSTTAQALASRDVAVAQMAGAGVLQSRLRGADLVLIGGLVNTLTFQFFVRKEISKPDHLKGKSVGVTRYGSSTDFAMRYALDKWELAPQKDVTIGEFGTMPDLLSSLESAKIHGAMLSSPFTLRAKQKGFSLLANLQMLGLEYQHTGIATTEALIKANPELIRNVMKAYVEGIHYYKNNRKESLAILEKYLRTNDAEALREVYEDIGLALVPEKPYPTLQGIQIMLRELASSEPKANSARPEQFVDVRFIKELDSSGFIDALYKPAAVAQGKRIIPKPAITNRVTPEIVKEESKPATVAAAGAPSKPTTDKKEETQPPAPASSHSSSASSDVQEHVVASGDTLSRIALTYYGDGSEPKWMTIYKANSRTIKNPHYIYIGQRLVIPADERPS